MNKKTVRFGITLLIIVAIFFGFFYSLPYYISKPGMAKELDTIVDVDGGYEGDGSFMLTTVRMGKANLVSYIRALFSDYQEIYPLEAIRDETETDEEYNVRQMYLMSSSKITAIEVACKKAGIPVEYKFHGVYVLNVVEDMPADGKLRPGDRIFEVDGKKIKSSEQFVNYIAGKKAGDVVTLTFKREGKVKKESLELRPFPDEENKVGIGIGLVDDKEAVTVPEIEIRTDNIGGPSAGLMFALEIYDQLTKEDLTRGYRIAGTGTLAPDGKVGRIGGIEQKVIAAHKSGAEIFFAPKEDGEQGIGELNYEAALRTAKDIGTDMKIVPVASFDEAVRYLEELPPKK